MEKYPPCPRPECLSTSTRPSRRQGAKEHALYRMIFLHMYRCKICRRRFSGRDIVPRTLFRRALPYLLIIATAIPVSLMVAFENRVPRPLLRDDSVAESGKARDRRRAPLTEEERERRKREIALRAKELVIKAIALHRGGMSGKEIVKMIRKDNPVYLLILDAFEDNTVPVPLVERSLDDWTEGVNVQKIGRQWQEKGVDVRTLVRQAEKEGLPVRKLMQEKDTGR